MLSPVGGRPRDDDAARGFVPEELHQRITAIPLDLSWLTAALRHERSILGDEMGLGKTCRPL